MMNKKGISIGRIILYVLFLSLIALFIYTLFITFKAMKKKRIEYNSVNCSLRMAYNNQFDYSATSYFSKYYMNIFDSGSIAVDVYHNTFNINSTGNLYPSYPVPNNTKAITVFYSATQGRSSNSYFVYGNYNDNVFDMSSVLNSFYSIGSDTSYELNNGDIDSINLFDEFTNNSACLVIECNIPVSIFDFSVTGSSVNVPGGDFYVCGSSIQNAPTYKCGWDSSHRFIHNNLPNAFLANYDTITKIIIPVWQTSVSDQQGFYIVKTPFNYNASLWSSSSFDIKFEFDIFTATQDEQDAYTAGYNAGLQAGDSALRDYNAELIAQVNSLENQLENVKSRVNQQNEIITQLNNQLQQSNNNFKGLFFTFADIPFKTVSNALGFEFWGVNLFKFFVGIITALGIVWLIKRIL